LSFFIRLPRIFQLLKSPTMQTLFALGAAMLGSLKVTLHRFPSSRYSFFIPAVFTGPSFDTSFLAVFFGAGFFTVVFLAAVCVFFAVTFSLSDFAISSLLFSSRFSGSFPSILNFPAAISRSAMTIPSFLGESTKYGAPLPICRTRLAAAWTSI